MIHAAVGAVDGEPGERGQEPVDFQYLLQITDQVRGKETVQGEKKPWPLLTAENYFAEHFIRHKKEGKLVFKSDFSNRIVLKSHIVPSFLTDVALMLKVQEMSGFSYGHSVDYILVKYHRCCYCRERQQSSDFSGSKITVIVPQDERFIQETESGAQAGWQNKYFPNLSAHQDSAVCKIRSEAFNILKYLLICKSDILTSGITDDSCGGDTDDEDLRKTYSGRGDVPVMFRSRIRELLKE